MRALTETNVILSSSISQSQGLGMGVLYVSIAFEVQTPCTTV